MNWAKRDTVHLFFSFFLALFALWFTEHEKRPHLKRSNSVRRRLSVTAPVTAAKLCPPFLFGKRNLNAAFEISAQFDPVGFGNQRLHLIDLFPLAFVTFH